MVRQAPVICVMAPPIHLGAWSMLWLPFELLLLFMVCYTSKNFTLVSPISGFIAQAMEASLQCSVILGELGSPSYHSHKIFNP